MVADVAQEAVRQRGCDWSWNPRRASQRAAATVAE